MEKSTQTEPFLPTVRQISHCEKATRNHLECVLRDPAREARIRHGGGRAVGMGGEVRERAGDGKLRDMARDEQQARSAEWKRAASWHYTPIPGTRVES
jgi:hypothetical protein